MGVGDCFVTKVIKFFIGAVLDNVSAAAFRGSYKLLFIKFEVANFE